MSHILSIVISFWSLTVASARLFYSQRLGIYREVFPPFKSVALIWLMIALVQAPFIMSLLLFFNTKSYYPIIFVLLNSMVSGFVTYIYEYKVKRKTTSTTISIESDEERLKLLIVSCLTSWIAPFTVVSNQPANRSKNLLLLGFTTVLMYGITNCFVLFFELDILALSMSRNGKQFFYFVLYVLPVCCVMIIPSISLMVLYFLGNYHNLYLLSRSCCCSPIVHRSLIYDYLVNTESEEHLPTFFKFFLMDDQKNVSLPHSGNTVLHVAFQHKRFRYVIP